MAAVYFIVIVWTIRMSTLTTWEVFENVEYYYYYRLEYYICFDLLLPGGAAAAARFFLSSRIFILIIIIHNYTHSEAIIRVLVTLFVSGRRIRQNSYGRWTYDIFLFLGWFRTRNARKTTTSLFERRKEKRKKEKCNPHMDGWRWRWRPNDGNNNDKRLIFVSFSRYLLP